MIPDEDLRDLIGGGIAGLALYILGLKATRGIISPEIIFSNIGLLILAGVFIGGGGVFSKLLRDYLQAR
ncbi:MAG: hypothetical protein ACI8Z7_000651 [Candidatus Nanohaloarchaea archaeon]|jgi:hypothetical protein